VVSAEILDYKTSRIETPEDLREKAEGYSGQMRLYRASLSKLLGLDPAAIRLRLIFTAPRAVAEVT
jgi:ATP-dependent exoDNAse (exonuclease V) beta subunit